MLNKEKFDFDALLTWYCADDDVEDYAIEKVLARVAARGTAPTPLNNSSEISSLSSLLRDYVREEFTLCLEPPLTPNSAYFNNEGTLHLPVATSLAAGKVRVFLVLKSDEEIPVSCGAVEYDGSGVITLFRSQMSMELLARDIRSRQCPADLFVVRGA